MTPMKFNGEPAYPPDQPTTMPYVDALARIAELELQLRELLDAVNDLVAALAAHQEALTLLDRRTRGGVGL